MFAKYSFCMALWSVTVSTACGDLPQHQSRGLIQVSYTRILVKLPWIALTHLETCANKQISSYLGLLLTTTTTIWILIAPFVNYVYAASFLLHWGGINPLPLLVQIKFFFSFVFSTRNEFDFMKNVAALFWIKTRSIPICSLVYEFY